MRVHDTAPQAGTWGSGYIGGERQNHTAETMPDPVAAFRAAMRDHGIETDDAIIPDGELHRFHVTGDRRGSRSGWYCLHIDGRPAGAFGSHRLTSGRTIKWSANGATVMSTAERRQLAERIHQQHHERAEAQRRAQDDAAAVAACLLAEAHPATTHPYLQRKGVQPHRAKIGRWWHDPTVECLLIPIIVDGKPVSLQAIFDAPLKDGRDKDFLPGGRKRGGYCPIGPKPAGDSTIVVCEGFATGASIHEATEHTVFVAFDAGNLEPVATALRTRFPSVDIIIAADNDQWTKRPDGSAWNPGIESATKAAQAVNGRVVVPSFAADDQQRRTDFNDLARTDGPDAVRRAFHVTIEQPTKEAAPPSKRPRGAAPPPPSDARILLAGGRAQALLDADEVLGRQPNVFQRNGGLVVISKVRDAKLRDENIVKRDPDSLLIQQATPDHVMNLLAEQRWIKLDRRNNEWIPVDYPPTYARGVVSATDWQSVRPLAGIIGAPTLDENMEVIGVPGYHANTGLLLATSTEFAPVPDEPTKDDAMAALSKLRYPFSEFPWVRREGETSATASESAHLAAILTGGIRHLFDTAPAVGYDAPRRGSGKSLLGDAVGAIWHGTAPAHANYAKGDDEFRKMIASCLVAGDRVIMVDNIDRPLRSPELCNALTTTRYSDRKLGYTERYVLDARVLWLLNGNNLAFVGDLARRVIVCTIDPEAERPENREFRIPHLLQFVAAHRAELAPAALTIVKAFALANPPQQAKPLGSFERWSRLVREALIWLDMPDPCATTDDVNEGEPEIQALAAVLTAWRASYGSAGRTAPQAVKDALEDWRDRALSDAFSAALGGPRDIEARALGYYLRRWKGVIVSGMRLKHAGSGHGGYAAWKVEQRVEDGSWR